MAKVICTLPNASNSINGIAFAEHELGMISEDVSDEVAASFTSIRGYVLSQPAATQPTARGKRTKAASSAPVGGDGGENETAQDGDGQGEHQNPDA